MAEFHTTHRVEFHETDMAGIVHFSNFFRYMEAAEVDYLRARGLNVRMDWEGERIGFPRVSAACDYVSPATFEDVLDITVIPANIGQKSVTYAFTISKNGKPVARGELTSVCCRITKDGLQSMVIPQRLRAMLGE